MIKILPHERVDILTKYKSILDEVDTIKHTGKVDKIIGLTIESIGPDVKYGEVCKVETGKSEYIYAEVVGYRAKNRPILMPIGDMTGVVPGAAVISMGSSFNAKVGYELLGRIIDGLGNPMDGKGAIFSKEKYPIDGTPINPLKRQMVDTPLSTGVRAIDGLMTVGRGQRLGIFSGSGVGKSTLLAMIAKYTNADINVIALIGERGREVRDFIENELGPEGLKKSIVIVATSDTAPMLRIRGALLAHSIAEYFRDQGKDVNLMMDSVTRFAMAQREVGLAAGEPTATKGYPPSVFSMLSRMLERSGSGEIGTITGFYTVLIEADDINDPISDSVRGILDGHIILDRAIANRGHYPAIDVLGSLSRCMKDVAEDGHIDAGVKFRELMASYVENEDMIMIGNYVRGSNAITDRAIDMRDSMNGFLQQKVKEGTNLKDTILELAELMNFEETTFAQNPDYVSSQLFGRNR